MGADADYNLLLAFKEVTGFRIAAKTEHIPITQLKYYPKDRSPPFVYLTGRHCSTQANLSSEEIKALRWYCLQDGGMLFIDNGGGNFDAWVHSMATHVFPNLTWVDIPNDDVIYHQPFDFPNGARRSFISPATAGWA